MWHENPHIYIYILFIWHKFTNGSNKQCQGVYKNHIYLTLNLPVTQLDVDAVRMEGFSVVAEPQIQKQEHNGCAGQPQDDQRHQKLVVHCYCKVCGYCNVIVIGNGIVIVIVMGLHELKMR